MSEKNTQYDPVEKVERMNRVFDHVVLPMLAFVVVMSVITGIILKPSCSGKKAEQPDAVSSQSQQNLDAYLLREVLLEDMEGNRGIFEQGGYTIVETEQSGLVAHRQLDEHTDIFDSIADSSGNHYSAVMYEDEKSSFSIRIYSQSIFLVEVSAGDKNISAIFRDDRFTTWTSGSDADASEVLALVPSEQLAGLVEQYKQSILSLVEE